MLLFGFEMSFSREVYVPREDTYLMVSALRDEVEEDYRVLDIGTGSGILAMIAGEVCEEVVAVDVNERAVELARQNASQNDFDNIEFLVSDLFENVEGSFDLVVFNAPYLPPSQEYEGPESEQWSGGEDGVEILERFSKDVADYLAEGGEILLLISSITGLKDVEEILDRNGLYVEVRSEEKIPWETLYVLEATRG